MRKVPTALLSDVVSFVTGNSLLGYFRGGSDRWLHPIDCSAMLDNPDQHFGPFDAGGLPKQNIAGIGVVYVPSRVAAYGFAHWNAYRRGDSNSSESVAKFLAVANWFSDFPDGRIVHNFPLLNLAPPWLSALAQGEALSIFARAFELTKADCWRQFAKKAAYWLSASTDAGGVLGTLPDGSPFLEEYPGTRHQSVLNGCLYGLAGLNDAADVGAVDTVLVNKVADAVEANLGYWNRRGWSLYQWTDPRNPVANYNTPSYQTVHIALLEHLGRQLKREEFLMEACRLERALDNRALRIFALANKLRYRLNSGW